MSASRAADLLVLALFEGALAGLPKPNALPWLHRLRSPRGAVFLLAPTGGEWPATVPLAVALVVLRLTGSFRARQASGREAGPRAVVSRSTSASGR